MADVPPDVFVKKVIAEETIPRSGRQITRDISSAIRRRDLDLLSCFQLRTLDAQTTDAINIPEIAFVKKLGSDGRGPEWYVDLEKYCDLLAAKTRNKKPRIATQDQRTAPPEIQANPRQPTDTPEASSSADKPADSDKYLTALIEEKEHRINELKHSKEYLEQLLQKLIGKDTLKALAEIVDNDSINSKQLGALVNMTSNKPAIATNENVAQKHHTEKSDVKFESENSENADIVIDVGPAKETPDKIELAKKTKEATSKKLRQSAKKKSARKTSKKKSKKKTLKWYEKPITIPFVTRKK